MQKKAELTIVVEGKGGKVPYKSFNTVLSNTVGILNSIAITITKSGAASVEWEITSVAMNSPLTITLTGHSPRRNLASKTVDSYVNGINAIQRNPEQPPFFADKDLEQASKIVSVLHDGVKSLKFRSDDYEANVSKTLTLNIQRIRRNIGHHSEYASFRGRLNDIRTSFGMRECIVRDFLTNNEIKCTYPEGEDQRIARLLLKRVEVSGFAKLTDKGELLSLAIADVHELPSAKRKVSETPGIDITGGMDAVDYIRKIRDGE